MTSKVFKLLYRGGGGGYTPTLLSESTFTSDATSTMSFVALQIKHNNNTKTDKTKEMQPKVGNFRPSYPF